MRCQSASSSMQAYINADNPAPDEDTLLTLIETNDQLSVALSKYQRGILNARIAQGANAAAAAAAVNNGDNASATPTATTTAPSPSPSPASVSSGAARPVPPPPPPPRNTNADLATSPVSPISTTPASNGTSRYQYNSDDFQVQNPFADNNATTTADSSTRHGNH